MSLHNTVKGSRWVINVPAGETVTVYAVMVDGTREQIAELTTAGQHSVTAQSGQIEVSDNAGLVTPALFSGAPGADGAGGGGATGEQFGKMMFAGSDDGSGNVTISADLTVKHATWFNNEKASSVSVVPAAWKNEVMTCYLKTAVPVELSGVQWLYGEPAMAQGYTYVIALQQIEPTTVLANLAYVLPQ